MRRTKIIATIGPASSSLETVTQMLAAGMDVARLNFSHGTHESHAQTIATLREAAQQADVPLAILQDLQGPKIRTGKLQDGNPVALVAGKSFTITIEPIVGTAARVSTTYEALPRDVQQGDCIMLSDGLIELRVVSTTSTDVHTEVVFGGDLRENQGINLPGVKVSAPSLTLKDIEDLEFGLTQDIDYVALSFVRQASDITDIKQRIAAAGKDIPVIAKIEKPEALADISEIIRLADGIMVARGDLGVEMPPQEVPAAQKMLIQAANTGGIPVITATQMLDSMIRNPRPTRAEASDVANAIIDGTDAVMLSGETASGKFPIEAVRMMASIAEATEARGWRVIKEEHTPDIVAPPERDIARAMSAAACTLVEEMPVKAIVGLTMTGNTARLVSRLRPKVPILAITPQESSYRRMNLLWGVKPLKGPYTDRLIKLSRQVHEELLKRHLAKLDDMVVLIGGHPLATLGSTNFVKAVRVGDMNPRTSGQEETASPKE